MRKLFTFLAAALMSVGMWADPNIVTPTISGDLSFTESTTVTMECTSPNSDIYYTTDGVTDPRCDCAAAPEYKHPITITETTIIKAAAYDGNDWSAVAEVTFTKVPASDPAGEVTVVFAANDKTVERTVTLPHTFKCSWDNGMDGPDELDIIIHELYNDYYYCNSNMNASGSDQVEV
ncbi:MAG: chitobiase/beta-hexosaminidase C-terminal domain-containing protein, partial [Paludibacteraceae bacterium]|nr:chitobiase/beta-hexosaminidase C-terminal domain-containing protein [Paludibacteraceae bacterium]